MLWLALAAVPSGLMLSTTTHLTTDIFAMPLLWVIPLGLYLLSFVVSFSDNRRIAWIFTVSTPFVMVLAGGMAMASRNTGTMSLAVSSVLLLFLVCIALHARLYDARPEANRLTLFYFVMSAGGALGGLFTALIAPLVFDWVWEHPLLVLAAAALLPREYLINLRALPDVDAKLRMLMVAALLALVAFMIWQLYELPFEPTANGPRSLFAMGVALVGILIVPWRIPFVAMMFCLMLAQGGLETIKATRDGQRSRSYFGVYTVREDSARQVRMLTHGTTLHGQQSLDPAQNKSSATYYGPTSGVGLVVGNAQALFGTGARIGVVGLGTGTLACYSKPGEIWRFYEIDPKVLDYSRDRTFTYLSDCTPTAKVVIGDARLELAREPHGSFDVLAIDAFSSDAIPLHLLTDEAMGVYLDALNPRGLLLIHISNRFIDLAPPLAAAARKRGLKALVRMDNPGEDAPLLTGSVWVLLGRDADSLASVRRLSGDSTWTPLGAAAKRAWTDDHASILPYVKWGNMMGMK